jgi:protein ImuB
MIDVVDSSGECVRVDGRGLLRSAPARLRLNGRWEPVIAWAGPWPYVERWWDPSAHRRRARFQLQAASDLAVLAYIEGGRWWAEATYD